MTKRAGIDHYRFNAKIWNLVGAFLQTINVIFGMVAVGLTITVASKPFGSSFPYPILAYLAALATAALTFVKAEERGRAWSKAGRHLEDAIGRYDIDSSYTFDSVAQARTEAVAMSNG